MKLFIYSSVLSLTLFPLVTHAKVLTESAVACPVTSVISGEKVTSNSERTEFTIKGDTVIRRIGIAVKASKPKSSVEVPFTWTAEKSDWGSVTGKLKLPEDGKMHCFHLYDLESIPANVAAGSLSFRPPQAAVITQVVFSERAHDQKMATCPKPEFFSEVSKAFHDSIAKRKDKKLFMVFLDRFKKLLPKYDCRIPDVSSLVPALHLATDYPTDRWLSYVACSNWIEGKCVFGSKLFRSVLDGETAEDHRKDSIKMEKSLSCK